MKIATQIATSGTFATEPEAWAHFDYLVEMNGKFKMHKEVCGEYVQPRYGTEDKGARIDRLLLPKKAAIDEGWVQGAIAIEGKKSGHGFSKLVSQALDYSRCVWRLSEGVPGLLVSTAWVFVYPVARDAIVGDWESLMEQNRVGWCMVENRRVVFGSSATHGLVLYDDGRMTWKPLLAGRKRGSR